MGLSIIKNKKNTRFRRRKETLRKSVVTTYYKKFSLILGKSDCTTYAVCACPDIIDSDYTSKIRIMVYSQLCQEIPSLAELEQLIIIIHHPSPQALGNDC